MKYTHTHTHKFSLSLSLSLSHTHTHTELTKTLGQVQLKWAVRNSSRIEPVALCRPSSTLQFSGVPNRPSKVFDQSNRLRWTLVLWDQLLLPWSLGHLYRMYKSRQKWRFSLQIFTIGLPSCSSLVPNHIPSLMSSVCNIKMLGMGLGMRPIPSLMS